MRWRHLVAVKSDGRGLKGTDVEERGGKRLNLSNLQVPLK